MNKEAFKQEMESRFGKRKHSRLGRIWSGLFLITIGALFFARESGVPFPSWFFTWPVLVIGLGLLMLVKHGFRSMAPLIMIAVGAVFLYDNLNDAVTLRPFIWPGVLVLFGLMIILRPKRYYRRRWRDRFMYEETPACATATTHTYTEEKDNAFADNSEVLEITTVFGGVKKKVLSKNFKGGDIVSIMGGTEVDLRQADFNEKVKIDNVAIFGGTKLIIPAEWDVQSDIVAIFGGVDDKRPLNAPAEPRKILLLEGTCLFGGIEIKHF